MKFRQVFALLPVLALCMGLVPAIAAQLMLSGVAYIPGQLTVDEVWSAGPNVPMQQMAYVTDGNPATHWNASAGGAEWLTQNYLMMSFHQGTTVSSLWMRIGDYAGATAYYSSGRPVHVSVQLWPASGSPIEYDYALDDIYKPDSFESGWNSGYQQLLLPYPIDNVTSIVVRVKQSAAGSYSSDVIISDIAVCGASYSVPDYTYPPVTEPPYDATQPLTGVLLQKMATRSGPSTKYTEPGTFLAKGDTVKVISLAYDNNDVPWVQVDFTAYGGHRRAYTGLKRIDLEAWQIPLEQPLNDGGYMRESVTPRTGPGNDYMACKGVTLAGGDSVLVMTEENGWLQIEFFVESGQTMRAWVPERCVSW